MNAFSPHYLFVATDQQPVGSDPSHQIKKVVRQSIDESHPGVQELVKAGYDPQDSVEAIEQSMGDVQEAMKILDNQEIEETEPEIFVRSTSREETIENQ